jgi:hypothetical protein
MEVEVKVPFESGLVSSADFKSTSICELTPSKVANPSAVLALSASIE